MEDTAIINMYDSKNSFEIPEYKHHKIKISRQIYNYNFTFQHSYLTNWSNKETISRYVDYEKYFQVNLPNWIFSLSILLSNSLFKLTAPT